ncbi:hypothetical protein [Propylenella binzhouense]|uniref:Uncharacterized protein n=1 Tax=Propylenella binzhouense TaxID=2555902 RepID=A0A964T6P7_9HYPH|nr:hypothetical protein [Propylenella binzhouense]MYZ48902.1 hypothetical protein [Propylenella binzhouense]
MPLQSELFKGDPAFEACLVKDSAHITKGSVGSHVAKIQYAVMALERFEITRSELLEGLYGTSTAAGVLAYKTRRNIINRAYQSRPDDIVGKMTIAALDAEMFALETLTDARSRIGRR